MYDTSRVGCAKKPEAGSTINYLYLKRFYIVVSDSVLPNGVLRRQRSFSRKVSEP
jgi:hypothetical protein